MGPVLGFGALVALIALALSGKKDSTPKESIHPSIEDDIKEVIKESEGAKGFAISSVPAFLASLGVSLARWQAYVKSQGGAAVGTKNRANHLGMFLMGPRMLVDLGYMENPRQVNGVWTGDWKSPYSESAYLSSPELQYKTFVEMSVMQAKQIKARFGDSIDLSGALAVAKRYGLGTLDKWVKDPANRQASTTGVYNQYKGML